MGEKEKNRKTYRCRAGDFARIKVAWNGLLVGAVVLVKGLLPYGRWETVVVGDPALGISTQAGRFVVTRLWRAEDKDLDPIGDEEALALLTVTDLGRPLDHCAHERGVELV